MCGIAIWALVGAYVVGLGAGFNSFFTGVMFLMLGGPVGFLVGGFTAETLVWGRL